MSESSLKRIVDQFLKDFNDMALMKDVSVREQHSKHQRKLRQLTDLVRAFEHSVRKDEGTKDG